MWEVLEKCRLCPRECGVSRNKSERGACGATGEIKVAKAYLHRWEEPPISGTNGSGTVFFSHCNLKCLFCQNYKISQEGYGQTVTVEKLADIFMHLQSKGAHNINLVTPTIYIPQIRDAILLAREKGLKLPIVYNTNAYERVEALRLLDGLIDIYLPDLKYYDDGLATRYSSAPGYFLHATRAILEMFRQVGEARFDENGIMTGGLMIRHLLLPGKLEDSKKILDWIKDNLPLGVYVNLMSQYTPYYKAIKYTELNKKVDAKEYDALIDYFLNIGLENGFVQEGESACEEFIPDFDLEGLE